MLWSCHATDQQAPSCLHLQGTGERAVPANRFFLGYRQVDLKPHELLYKVPCCAEELVEIRGSFVT
jgi:xanthine dehydrogenase iron-sulfur cluster and FAD-binding subunit A